MHQDLFNAFHEEQRRSEEEQLKAILEKPYLSPEEIWDLSQENFIQWRKKYDFPNILSHFSNNLKGFDDWKNEYKLDDDFLMNFGISTCINAAPAKNKTKYLVEQNYQGQKSQFISFLNMNGKYYNMGPNTVNHTVLKTFVGYVDWCINQKILFLEGHRDYDLLGYPTTSRPPGAPYNNEVSILNGLHLLKVGGIKIMPGQFGLIKAKHFDFVNADYLQLSGEIATRNQPILFQNSTVNNLTCENLDISMVQFEGCKMSHINITQSAIRQWFFNFCDVNGKMNSSDLRWVKILGGNFHVDFKDCNFLDVDARQSQKKELSFEYTYRELKRVYAGQAEDKKAIEYFLLEKNAERRRIRKYILNYRPQTIFEQSKGMYLLHASKHFLLHSWLFLVLWTNNFYWGYGRKPYRVIRNSFLIIVLFAFIYYFGHSHIHLPDSSQSLSFWDSLYYSTTTFTTLGYGDFYPLGYLRFYAGLEATIGGVSFGFMAAAFTNFRY